MSFVSTCFSRCSAVAACGVLLVLAGCGQSVDPRIAAIRTRFLSDAALTGEQPVPEIRKHLIPKKPFTIRARINAGDIPPWGTGKAEFMVTDATGHDGDESHDPHECPFCKRDINSVLAWVEFHDESGKSISIDSRDLFGLKEFDLVQIEGTGRINDDDILVIDARRMFVVR